MDKKVVFILGNSRSGTTMLGRILSNNADVFTFRELHFFEQLCDSTKLNKIISFDLAVKLFARLIALQRDGYMLVKDINPSYLNESKLFFSENNIGATNPISVYENFLYYESKRHNKTIPCEQTPRNVFFIEDILNNFKYKAKCIVMIRDPRDILLSQKRKWMRKRLGMPQLPLMETIRTWMNYHPITISLLWQSVMHSIKYTKGDPRVIFVKYEKLLDNPKRVLDNICCFLDLSFDSEMLAISMRDSSNRIDDKDAVGIDAGRQGQWKLGGLNTVEIWLCQHLAKSEMAEWGYQYDNIKLSFFNVFVLLAYIIIFPIKLIAAFILNLHRMKNPINSILMRLRAII